jgi:hypothetical protein
MRLLFVFVVLSLLFFSLFTTMGWDGMGWDGMGWDGMGWDGFCPSRFQARSPLFLLWVEQVGVRIKVRLRV